MPKRNWCLGHTCTSEGVKPEADKVKCVQDFPQQKTVRQFYSFLG